MREPQIGIEPMTACVLEVLLGAYLLMSQHLPLLSNMWKMPETRPKIDKSGNEMATGNRVLEVA